MASTSGAPGSSATTWSSQIFSTMVRGVVMTGSLDCSAGLTERSG
jgi:hypothetical protein